MNRLSSIDFVRGLVMVIMALDHTRDLFHVAALTSDPLNLTTTTPLLFMTRWITHLCAPIFVFLSGVSAWLSFQQMSDVKASRRFLWTRGLWLILLEFTVINFGIWFNPTFDILMSQVIGAIGFGMVVLSFLLRLSPKTVGLLGLTIIFGHNLLQNINFPVETPLHFIWGYLFRLSFFQISPDFIFFVNYPLIPWLGILLAGFGLGQYLGLPTEPRRKMLLRLSLGALSIFVLLRSFNLYGDSQLWSSVQKNVIFAGLSFLNVSKYPPSLLFVCVTLGIGFLLLHWADMRTNRLTRFFAVYGKVPLFYYLLHWYLLHNLMLGLMLWQGFKWSELNFEPFGFGRPKQGGGLELGGVYLVWLAVVLALYPLSKWYGRYKAANRDKVWLRYL